MKLWHQQPRISEYIPEASMRKVRTAYKNRTKQTPDKQLTCQQLTHSTGEQAFQENTLRITRRKRACPADIQQIISWVCENLLIIGYFGEKIFAAK